MKNILNGCEPSRLFRIFEEISDIPRGSGNEKGIADYLERFAKERGIYCKRDAFNNVFMRKTAARGLAGKPSVLFQAHTDMVCVAREGVSHDFLSTPPSLMTDGKYIFADGTSLGADDGAGVAVMLALIDDGELIAPETEYLFTSSEETGMDGAFGFDCSEVRSELVVNLDSEEEFNACIGSAGGIHAEITVPSERVKAEGKIYRIALSGLAGGHSGTDIDLCRRSAVKLLALILGRLYKLYPFHIIELYGGGRDNVIPSAAEAVIAFVDGTEAKRAKNALTEIKKEIFSVLVKEDKRGFSLRSASLANTEASEENTVSDAELLKITENGMLSLKSTSRLISLLALFPQGVTDRYTDGGIAGSVNLGSVKTGAESTEMHCLIRSGEPFFSEKTLLEIERLAHLCGGKAEVSGRYPGWESKRGERLQEIYADAIRELYGKEAVFSRVHAGLECGIIYEKLSSRGLKPQVISIGANNLFIHTPNEKMEIASFARLYETVKRMIEEKR